MFGSEMRLVGIGSRSELPRVWKTNLQSELATRFDWHARRMASMTEGSTGFGGFNGFGGSSGALDKVCPPALATYTTMSIKEKFWGEQHARYSLGVAYDRVAVAVQSKKKNPPNPLNPPNPV
jgi:hypothetical protein